MSAATKGIPRSREWVEKVAACLRGKKRPAEVCAKMRKPKLNYPEAKRKADKAYRKGLPMSQEIRDKISQANKGIPKPLWWRLKIGKGNLGKKRTPEVKARISETLKRLNAAKCAA